MKDDIRLKINQLAQELSSSETPFLDARYFYEAYPEARAAEVAAFKKRRNAGEPVAKILGKKGFWTFDLTVSRDVLDPRPDSETLIEAVLNDVPAKEGLLRILDVGTGSGCLLLALLSEYQAAEGIGVDKSQKALEIAQKNAKNLKLEKRVFFIHKDMCQNEFGTDLGVFDVIVSNPPYIPSVEIETLSNDVKLYDPIMALDGGADGLMFYRALSRCLWKNVHAESRVYFEIGQGQEKDVIDIMTQAGWRFLCSYRDLGGIIRVLSFRAK